MREAKEEALRLQEAISAAREDRDDNPDTPPVRRYCYFMHHAQLPFNLCQPVVC